MPGAKDFPDAKLNFAENLLRHVSEGSALIFCREDGMERILSGDELEALASRLAQALLAMGVEPGDRISSQHPGKCGLHGGRFGYRRCLDVVFPGFWRAGCVGPVWPN